jgi:2-polyprenyl-3-methyl-5-hydroxy-6-metoxy-1,4-benzoquinol methylase/ribosomal protein S27E
LKQKSIDALKETDIRPDEIIEKQGRYIEIDRKRLLRNKQKFVEVDCPACSGGNTKKAFVKNELTYVVCVDCGTLYVNPRPTAEILGRFYAESVVYEYWNKFVYPASDKARRKFIFRPRVGRIIEFCRKYRLRDVTLMEVGAGFGTFCNEAQASGFFKNVIAVEPTRAGAESCRKKKIYILEEQIENVSLDPETINIIVSFEVIEHLFSPRDLLVNCFRLLRKGGLIVLSCPNIMGFDNLVLGSTSPSIDHEHLNYFTPCSLAHLVRDCGFRVLETLTPGKLDAEIVRKQVLKGNYSLYDQPFLRHILIDKWDDVGLNFQKFLADNQLSSHMWIVASKK